MIPPRLRHRQGELVPSKIITSPFASWLRSTYDDERALAIAINTQTAIDNGEVPRDAAFAALAEEFLCEEDRGVLISKIHEFAGPGNQHDIQLEVWIAAIRAVSATQGHYCEEAQAIHYATRTLAELKSAEIPEERLANEFRAIQDPDTATISAYLALFEKRTKEGRGIALAKIANLTPHGWSKWRPLLRAARAAMIEPSNPSTLTKLSAVIGHDALVEWLFGALRRSDVALIAKGSAQAKLEAGKALVRLGRHKEAERGFAKIPEATLTVAQLAQRRAYLERLQ